MKASDLGSEGHVVEEFQHRFELVEIVSTILESPEVVMCVPRTLSLIMVRDCIQRSTVLAVVPGNNTDHVGVRTHDHPSEAGRHTSPPIVSDNTGDIIGPSVVIKA